MEQNYSSNYEYYEVPQKYDYFENKITNKYSEPVCVIKDITLEDAIEEISKRFVLIPKTKASTTDNFSERQKSKVDRFDKKAQYRHDIDQKNYNDFDYVAKEIQDTKAVLSEDSENSLRENDFDKLKQNVENYSEKYPSLLQYSDNKIHNNSDDAIEIIKNETLEKTNPESQLQYSEIIENIQEMKLDDKNEVREIEKIEIPPEQLETINQVEEGQLYVENIPAQPVNNADRPVPENNVQYETFDEIPTDDKDNFQYNQVQYEQNYPQQVYNNHDQQENLQTELTKNETEINSYNNENNNRIYDHAEEQNQDYSHTQQPIEGDNTYYIHQDQNYDTGIYNQENITNPDDTQQSYDQTEYEQQPVINNDQEEQPITQDVSYYNQDEIQQQCNENTDDPNYYSQENQNYPVETEATDQAILDPNYYPQNGTEGDQNQYYYDQSQENNYYNQEGVGVSSEVETHNTMYQGAENYNTNDYVTDASNVQYEGEYQEYAHPDNTEYVENVPENPEQYVENNDQQLNSQYYGENIVAENLTASQIGETNVEPLKILDSDIEYENSTKEDQSKQESDFDFSISQQ